MIKIITTHVLPFADFRIHDSW